jgi:hypothetical protein
MLRTLMILIGCLTLWASTCAAQLQQPPANLPGFKRFVDANDQVWWHRSVEGRDYFMRPTKDVWNYSPLSVVDSKDTTYFGVMLGDFPEATGFSTGGGNVSAEQCGPDEDCPEPPKPQSPSGGEDGIEQFLRRRGMEPSTVLIGVFALVGSVVVLVLAVSALVAVVIWKRR